MYILVGLLEYPQGPMSKDQTSSKQISRSALLNTMRRVYQVITDRIIGLLEDGSVPWHRPWGIVDGLPKNLISRKEYRGINVFLLGAAGYESPYWVSFRQARNHGGTVRRGEKGFPCVYWNWLEKNDKESGETKKIPFVRYYTVFNVQQCDGVDYPVANQQLNQTPPIESCESIVATMTNSPRIEHGRTGASYLPSCDTVTMPARASFERAQDYYAVLFHELTHSTGHESRLSRKGVTERIVFGSHAYRDEELVGEMGATFLCASARIENDVIDNSAAYIRGWLNRFKSDNRLVVRAAAQAQKAADYILGRRYPNED